MKKTFSITCYLIPLQLSVPFSLFSPALRKNNAPTLISLNKNIELSSQYDLLASRKSTALYGNLWDRLQIEEDEEPMWYLLNCVAGLELDLLSCCRIRCEDMEDAIKFVVPIEKQTRSHGKNRILTETKVKYQGYVFGKLRLTEETYEAIQGLDLCRSWMGTVNKRGGRKLPPAPVALNEMEIENFGLEGLEEGMESGDVQEDDTINEEGIILDTEETDAKHEAMKPKIDQEQLDAFMGLLPDDMIKVTGNGKFKGEDGIVKRLKGGRIMVRFFTYGSIYDEWLDPKDVRKMSDDEVLRGLQGPDRPIMQRDMENPTRDGWSGRNGQGGGLRDSLMSNVGGNQQGRNRRQDRNERRSNRRNFLEDDDQKQQERNWAWYQKQQKENVDDFTVGSREQENVDSQWGRNSGRRERRERKKYDNSNRRDFRNVSDGNGDWSNFVSTSPSPSEERRNNKKDNDDAFFDSLMSELNGERQQEQQKKQGQTASTDDDDDFFSSLMSELEAGEGKSNRDRNAPSSRPKRGNERSNDNDFTDTDFFANLEKELSTSKSGGGNDDEDMDDFFSKLEAEMGGVGIDDSKDNGDPLFSGTKDFAPQSSKDDGNVDDFFAELEKDLASSDSNYNEDRISPNDGDNGDDFFSELEKDLATSSKSEDDNVDDFFAKLEQDLSSEKEMKKNQEKDEFFSQLESDLDTSSNTIVTMNEEDINGLSTKGRSTSKTSPASKNNPESSNSGIDESSLAKKTVPILKDMLRERGLKVSGKKAELIERLLQT